VADVRRSEQGLIAQPFRRVDPKPELQRLPQQFRAIVPGYNRPVGWEQRITVNPGIRSGKPCIKGTRITVYDVLEYLAGGMSEDQILSDLPDLTREDIRAALACAATRERRLANSVA